MKRVKFHRKPVFYKGKHNSNTNIKFKKGLVKITRDFIESQDKNRAWEDDSMSRNMVSTTAVNRANSIF
jgi:hypothetical protein